MNTTAAAVASRGAAALAGILPAGTGIIEIVGRKPAVARRVDRIRRHFDVVQRPSAQRAGDHFLAPAIGRFKQQPVIGVLC